MLLVSDKSMIKQFPFVNESRIQIVAYPVPENWVMAWPSLPPLVPAKENSQPLVILHVSCWSMERNMEELFEALRLLGTAKKWELHLARQVEGNGQHNAAYSWDKTHEIIQRYQWEERVYCHDVLTDDDKVSLFAECHVLVLPSYWEAVPTIVLEAMYAGLAVIAGKGEGTLGSLISSEFLYDRGNGEQLADRLRRLTGEKARVVGQRNRRIMERGYLPQQVIPLLLRVYESLEPGIPMSQKLRVIRPGKKTKATRNKKAKF